MGMQDRKSVKVNRLFYWSVLLPSVTTTRIKINIVLTGGYALCAVLVILSAYLLTVGFSEWINFFQWGVGLAVFFTVTWAVLRGLFG